MQQAFLEFALNHDVISFGEFTLKSGRISPYFYDARLFDTGALLTQLGEFYAQRILDSKLEFDMLFGPAYAGISLVCSTAMALARQGRDVPFCFNRKEAKTHGKASQLVGAPLQGKVLIIDDVITAGTAFREAMAFIETAGAQVTGVVVQFDRQEKGQGELSAIQEIEQACHIPVLSLMSLSDCEQYLSKQKHPALAKVSAYRQQYGAD